jgi:hypothetical protein
MPILSLAQQKIEQTRDYLFATDDIPEPQKDGLIDQLNAAELAVSSMDAEQVQRLCDLVAVRTCYEVKQSIWMNDQIKSAIKEGIAAHAADCMGKTLVSVPQGKLGVFMKCINSWPLAAVVIVALVAPRSVTVIESIFKLFK